MQMQAHRDCRLHKPLSPHKHSYSILNTGIPSFILNHFSIRRVYSKFTDTYVFLCVYKHIFNVYFKVSEIEREGEAERGRSPISCFTSQMTLVVGDGPSQRQEPGTPSRSTTWVAGIQVLGLLSAAFPGALAGSWIRNRSWNLNWHSDTGY